MKEKISLISLLFHLTTIFINLIQQEIFNCLQTKIILILIILIFLFFCDFYSWRFERHTLSYATGEGGSFEDSESGIVVRENEVTVLMILTSKWRRSKEIPHKRKQSILISTNFLKTGVLLKLPRPQLTISQSDHETEERLNQNSKMSVARCSWCRH